MNNNNFGILTTICIVVVFVTLLFFMTSEQYSPQSTLFVMIIGISIAVFIGEISKKIFPKKRNKDTVTHKINHESRIVIGIMALGIGAMFISGGMIIMEFSNLLKEDIAQRNYSIDIPTRIDFEDPEPLREWMIRAEIISNDDRPLLEGIEKRLDVTVESKIIPEELVIHIFHEDMKDFFTNENDPSAFRQITKSLDRIPTLGYGPMFSLQINTTKYEKCVVDQEICIYNLQATDVGEFSKAGKYLVQFSAKLESNQYEHRLSPFSLPDIVDEKTEKFNEQISKISKSVDEQKADSRNSQGYAFLGIGIGMVFSGVSLILPQNILKIRNQDE
ncbi:MAG: hypothetical protein ACW9W3_00975 [Candidatus Nitrosopumilus sp. bin_68KS]